MCGLLWFAFVHDVHDVSEKRKMVVDAFRSPAVKLSFS
jgi:hypothetical protein